jgi:hypothetical protein
LDEEIATHPELEVGYFNYCLFALARHGRNVYSLLASKKHFWLWLTLTKGPRSKETCKKDRVSQRKLKKNQRKTKEKPKKTPGKMVLF